MNRLLLGLVWSVALACGLATEPTAARAGEAPSLINVNIDTTARIESLLEGPAGGLDTIWNQVLGGPGGIAGLSASGLLDSNGESTAVGFTTDAGNLYDWGTPSLQLLASGAFQWDWDVPSSLVISDLESGYYDLYIASYHPNELGGGGVFTTQNPTTSGETQIADNGGPGGNASTWEQGVNYVVFENVQPDAEGRITVSMVSSGPSNARRAYLSGFQLLRHDAPVLSSAKDIVTFDFPGLPDAVISVASISLTAPFGTDVTALAPTYTLSPLATAVPASGSTQDFTDPVVYTVTAEDGSTKEYTVTVTVTPISTAKDILTFGLPGLPAVITGTDIAWPVPLGTDLTNLAPVYTVSPFATGNPPSGTARSFTSPKTYTITAQDASTQVYTVTVTPKSASPLINVNIDVEKRDGSLLEGPAGGLGTVWNQATADGASFKRELTDLMDSDGLLSTVGFTENACCVNPWGEGPVDKPLLLAAAAFEFGSPASNAMVLSGLTPGYYDVYIASGYPNENGSQGIFTTTNTTSNGLDQAVDNGVRNFVGGNLSTWAQGENFVLFHNTEPDLSNVINITFNSFAGSRCMVSGFQLVWHAAPTTFTGKDILTFVIPHGLFDGNDIKGVINGNSITAEVPQGTDVTNLAPRYSMSPMATGVPPSGEVQDFTDPVDYTVTAEDGSKKTYTVTVTEHTISSAASILTFGLPGMWAVIDQDEATIDWNVAEGTDVTNLAPLYTVSPFALEDLFYPSGTPRDFTDPVEYTIVAEDGITTKTYTVTVTLGGRPKFVRGDANADVSLNITDGIYVLNYLFLGGPEPTCLEAGNANDDETLNITDGIYILNYLFLGGPEPPAPGAATCGLDPDGSPTDLGCVAYPGC